MLGTAVAVLIVDLPKLSCAAACRWIGRLRDGLPLT
jgi:hypothetical protein